MRSRLRHWHAQSVSIATGLHTYGTPYACMRSRVSICMHALARAHVAVLVCGMLVCVYTFYPRIPAAMSERSKTSIAVTAKQRRSHHRHRGLGISFDLAAL